MNEVRIAIFVFLCLSAASLGALFCYERLPEHQRQDDTQKVLHLIANIFVVMTSLVLGLMISSAKSRFDGVNQDVHSYATELILLDRMLFLYGPEAGDTRQRLVTYTERAANSHWTAEGGLSRVVALLDWELSTLGHPLADLAHSAMAWLSGPDEYGGIYGLDLDALGIPSLETYQAAYDGEARHGARLETFHMVFALFRWSMIFEGIAARAKAGTANAADAADTGRLAAAFAKRAVDLI